MKPSHRMDPRASKYAIQAILSGTCTILVGMELHKRLHGKNPENLERVPFTMFSKKNER